MQKASRGVSNQDVQETQSGFPITFEISLPAEEVPAILCTEISNNADAPAQEARERT